MFEDLLKEIEATQEERRPTTGPEESPDLPRLARREALAAVKRGDVARIVSATLGESVYWVRDEETAERLKREPDYRGEVIYTLAELRELAGQSPELLRDIHQFKKTFGATLWKVNQGVNARSINTVCFQRVDHPHICKGSSKQDKAAVIQNLKDRLTESERRSEASEQSWFAVLQKLEIARAELLEAREHIEFLDQVNVNLIEYSRELRMQGLELEDSLAMEKAYNRMMMWMLRIHKPASGLSEQDIRLLLQLCHPDKHDGSAASEKATQLLLGLRKAKGLD
jgi:hypothetical protein